MADFDGRMYNEGSAADSSSIDTTKDQFSQFHYYKKALIDIKKEQYFGQLADVRSMPKHMGKKIKQYHYIPLLDDRNINDQGLDASGASIANGNLYGSSKDIGTISGKLPALSETGGRKNRVGFKRIELEGSIEKFGFFDEYTQETIDFDSDSQLQEHITRESLRGANEITEDALQIDLLNGAGVVRYGGVALAAAEITGEGDDLSVVDYEDLMRLAIEMDDNRCPKSTTMITGSRMTDTKVIEGARYMYIGTELIPSLKRMKDLHNNQAFIGVQHYGEAGTIARGEKGSIDDWRFIVVPEMQHWAGTGAAETEANAGYRATSGKYDIFPMLAVGSGSFTTIGFQTDGKTVKFKIKHSKPGSEASYALDPYGETGFYSIKWYYGTMILRPEWIGLIKTVAEL